MGSYLSRRQINNGFVPVAVTLARLTLCSAKTKFRRPRLPIREAALSNAKVVERRESSRPKLFGALARWRRRYLCRFDVALRPSVFRDVPEMARPAMPLPFGKARTATPAMRAGGGAILGAPILITAAPARAVTWGFDLNSGCSHGVPQRNRYRRPRILPAAY